MITFIKSMIGKYGIFLAIIIACSGWLAYGVQTIRLRNTQQLEASLRNAWDAELLRAAQEAQKTAENYRSEEARRNEAVRKAVEDEAVKTKSAKADAVAAGSALERLRQRVAASANCGASSSNPGTPQPSKATRTTGDMQTDVLGRVGEAAGLIAAHADAARIAGEACQVSYQGLGK